MESRSKLFGHPVHPMLIVLPIALLPVSVVFDLVYLTTSNVKWAEFSFWLLSIGIVGGLSAAIFGIVDFLAIDKRTRAKRIGLLHGAGNVVMIMLFSWGWALRAADSDSFPPGLAIALSVIGVLLSILTSWLGGELVFRLGVGVDRGANLDAPSSLGQYDVKEPRLHEYSESFPEEERPGL